MIYFINDYLRGAHPKVLNALVNTNMEQTAGYGFDEYTAMAEEKIKKICNCAEGKVYFLQGGTQTNKIAIASMISHFEGVMCPESAHISTNEAGTVEETGHKVLTLAHKDGKVEANTIDEHMQKFFRDETYMHKVLPAMVFISQPTEYGTIYSKSELKAISDVCKKWEIPLYIDGARLIYALASPENDATLEDVAKYADAFYIGGTKAGLLLGEALIFTKNNAPKSFITMIKRYGGLLAKGRVVSLQFNEMFTDDLYKELGENAIDKATKIVKALEEKNYQLYVKPSSNQIFVVLENKKVEELAKEVKFLRYKEYDENHTVIRLVTSWATTEEETQKLIEILKR